MLYVSHMTTNHHQLIFVNFDKESRSWMQPRFLHGHLALVRPIDDPWEAGQKAVVNVFHTLQGINPVIHGLHWTLAVKAPLHSISVGQPHQHLEDQKEASLPVAAIRAEQDTARWPTELVLSRVAFGCFDNSAACLP